MKLLTVFLLLIVTGGHAILADDRPNIVFMLSDDQSWSGTSVAMHPNFAFSRSDIIQTPSLEKLASQGMRFSAAYAPSPVCSSTRCSLQLGMSTAQTGWTKASATMTAQHGFRLIPPSINRSLHPDSTTIAEVLKRAGYATAHFGKWHLNGGGPGQHGYDQHDGNTNNDYAFRFRDPNPVDIFGMANRAADFMDESLKAGKPFFIQLSWHALHAPENALKSTIAKYEQLARTRNVRVSPGAAISEDLDTGVGMVMDAIQQLGLADNTYVIYMSDNGGGGRHSPLSGGKGSVREGGIRSPMIIRGPGIAPNSWCHTTVSGLDLFPTYCEWARVPARSLPKGLEGGSLSSILDSGGRGEIRRPREEVVFHFPHYQSADGPHSALILGDLKLIKFYEDDRLELFDLSRDIQERNDLSQQMPSETTQLHKRLNDYLADVGARLPVPNPSFDPRNAPALTQRNGGGGQRTGARPGKPNRPQRGTRKQRRR